MYFYKPYIKKDLCSLESEFSKFLLAQNIVLNPSPLENLDILIQYEKFTLNKSFESNLIRATTPYIPKHSDHLLSDFTLNSFQGTCLLDDQPIDVYNFVHDLIYIGNLSDIKFPFMENATDIDFLRDKVEEFFNPITLSCFNKLSYLPNKIERKYRRNFDFKIPSITNERLSIALSSSTYFSENQNLINFLNSQAFSFTNLITYKLRFVKYYLLPSKEKFHTLPSSIGIDIDDVVCFLNKEIINRYMTLVIGLPQFYIRNPDLIKQTIELVNKIRLLKQIFPDQKLIVAISDEYWDYLNHLRKDAKTWTWLNNQVHENIFNILEEDQDVYVYLFYSDEDKDYWSCSVIPRGLITWEVDFRNEYETTSFEIIDKKNRKKAIQVCREVEISFLNQVNAMSQKISKYNIDKSLSNNIIQGLLGC